MNSWKARFGVGVGCSAGIRVAGNIAFRVGTGVALFCVESGSAVTGGCAAPEILRSEVLGGGGAVVSEGVWDVPVAGGPAGAGVGVSEGSSRSGI